MRIDNAQLAAFAAVLNDGTFELAARRLNVTPSAVSQRVKLLEERMGQVLIQRGAPCVPTAAGRTLLRLAQEIALREAEVFSELGVGDGADPACVRIPVVVNADSLDTWFGRVFQALPAIAPFMLDIRMEDQDHSVALLREGAVMAGVSASRAPIQGCRVEPLGTMRYLAVGAPAYVRRHFAGGIGKEQLRQAPMLVFNKKDGLQAAFLARLTDAPIAPPGHLVPSTRSFLEAARAGAGWGMIPEQMALPALQAGELVEIAPGNWLDIPLYWHRWRIGSSTLDALTAIVRAAGRAALAPG